MKKELRENIFAHRDAMTKEEVIEKSSKICGSLASYLLKEEVKTVMVYLPTGNETNILPMIQELLSQGKQVAAPVCIGKGIMVPSLITNLDSDLEEGVFGILAPKKQRPVELKDIDAVIIPGVGFDAHGNRLGFGGGFYDRFLPKMRADAKKIAVCYDYQILKNFTPEPWDFPVDTVITDTQIYTVK